MLNSILEILAKLLGLTDFFIRRRAAKNDDPKNKLQKSKEQNAASIAEGSAGERLDSQLDRLHRLPKPKAD